MPIQVSDIISSSLNLGQFSTIVIADNPAPGLTDPSTDLTTYKDKLVEFVRRGGNLVLTDGALKLLGTMGFIAPSNVARQHFYAGFTAFTTNGGGNDTYGDPLAANVNQPGAAEGPSHRHQTYEPVPLGFDIGARQSCSGEPPAPPPPGQTQTVNTCMSPHWTVAQTAWQTPLMGANARTVGQTNNGRTALGELQLGCGRVRIAGALLPMPVERYYHRSVWPTTRSRIRGGRCSRTLFSGTGRGSARGDKASPPADGRGRAKGRRLPPPPVAPERPSAKYRGRGIGFLTSARL